MSNPDDDTDVPSGFNDDAEMERTPSRSSEMVIIGTSYFDTCTDFDVCANRFSEDAWGSG